MHIRGPGKRKREMNVLELKDVSYSYLNRAKAVDSVSFTVSRGESLSIIGTNGSGKSTLLYILNGLIKPESGKIFAFGAEIEDGYPLWLRQRVSLLFQNSHAQLFSLSVWDELLFGPLQLGLGIKEAGQRAEDISQMLGIGHLKDRGPWDLSGGEMKKVALGTCLSTNPDVLLLDEPTSGLDPRSQVEITDLIIGLREAGKTIITATNDLHIIGDISDRTIVIGEDHRVLLEAGPWEALEDHDSLLKANLIHKHLHRHSWYEHEHSHWGAHEHEHEEAAPAKETDESPLTDTGRLKILLGHWDEHNAEHAETYLEWASKAEEMGRPSLARTLREIAGETKKMEGLFKKAQGDL